MEWRSFGFGALTAFIGLAMLGSATRPLPLRLSTPEALFVEVSDDGEARYRTDAGTVSGVAALVFFPGPAAGGGRAFVAGSGQAVVDVVERLRALGWTV